MKNNKLLDLSDFEYQIEVMIGTIFERLEGVLEDQAFIDFTCNEDEAFEEEESDTTAQYLEDLIRATFTDKVLDCFLEYKVHFLEYYVQCYNKHYKDYVKCYVNVKNTK